MQFILASKNRKKLEEMNRILTPLGVEVVNETALGIVLPDVAETGTTFLENAKLKAVSAMQNSGLPAIADDSGLCVDALDGAPGVFSARYSGEHGDDASNNALLLKNMQNVPPNRRSAHFVSAIYVAFPNGAYITAEGRCDGFIGFAPAGENGFGYDPLFMVGEQSFAQLTPAQKDQISHRGNALRQLLQKLQVYLKEHTDVSETPFSDGNR